MSSMPDMPNNRSLEPQYTKDQIEAYNAARRQTVPSAILSATRRAELRSAQETRRGFREAAAIVGMFAVGAVGLLYNAHRHDEATLASAQPVEQTAFGFEQEAGLAYDDTAECIVQPFQTIWNLARPVAEARGVDVRQVVDEIKDINGLSSSQVYVGQLLSVPTIAGQEQVEGC